MKNIRITIYDSLKILPFKVSDVATSFGLPVTKLEIDYDAPREMGHQLTQDETAYIRADVTIMAMALKILFEQNLKQITQGSNALHDYKQIITKKQFNYWFPTPDYDVDIRQSYRGGFTYLNPKFSDKPIAAGVVLDVNSLYPYVMYDKLLPYGEGKFFNGRYVKDDLYPLYTQLFTCQFKIKRNHIPTVQLKNNSRFVPTEYVTSSAGEDITLCLTSVDLELFLEQYNIYNITYHSGWKFKASNKLFKSYIDKWYKVKQDASLSGNKPMRKLAKLMLNALYGKFALNPSVQSKIPTYDNGKIHYVLGPKETRKPVYIPVGTFITAWARNITIRAAQSVYTRFIYADTDSLHLLGDKLPNNLEIDPVNLGAWKHESTFTRAKFIHSKCYVEEIDGILYKTIAGMPTQCHQYVTWDNFSKGSSFAGKLQPKHVAGGIVLMDIDITIKG